MAFSIHTLHISRIITPLQRRRRVPSRLGSGAELLRRIALARPIVLLERLQGRTRVWQDQDTGASWDGGTGIHEPQDAGQETQFAGTHWASLSNMNQFQGQQRF